MPTRAQIADVIRTKNPKFKDLSDIEIEAIVGAQDPRYRDLFNRASGVDPGLGPEKPPDPSTYYTSSPRNEALMQLERENASPPLSVDTAVNAIPAAAGMGGGMAGFALGGPLGAIGGAGAAGSAGEGLRQWIQSKRGKEGPRALPDRAAGVVKEGGIQALQEIFGQSVAGLQRAVAPSIYKYALDPSTRLEREYPTMAEDALAARLPISKRGLARAQAAATAGGQQADALIAAAEKSGARPIDLMGDIINPMLGDVGPMAENLAKTGLPQGREALTERIRNAQEEFRATPPRITAEPEPRPLSPGNVALAEQQAQLGPAQSSLVPARIFGPTSHEVRTGLELGPQAALVPQRMISGPGPVVETPPPLPVKPFRDIGLTEGQGIKREMQDQANTAFRAQEAGNEINSVQAAANQGFANKYKVALEDRVPGLAEQNATTQRALGVSEGIDAARRRGGLASNIVSGVVAGGGAVPALVTGHPWLALTLGGAGALTKAATSPYALSRAAIALDQLGSHPNLQSNVYRAMVEALRQSLAGDNSNKDAADGIVAANPDLR